MRVYVAVSNDSHEKGDFLEINDFVTVEDFIEGCVEVSEKYGETNFVFVGFQCTVPGLTDGESIETLTANQLFLLNEDVEHADCEGNLDAFVSYLKAFEVDYEDGNLHYDDFVDAYAGKFETEIEFAEYLYREGGKLNNVPDDVISYIDWERLWNCDLSYYFTTERSSNGGIYFFHNN